MTRTIYMSKEQQVYINDLLVLNNEELKKKYALQSGKIYSQKFFFTKDILAEVFIEMNQKGTTVKGFMKEYRCIEPDIENIPCLTKNTDFFGTWCFEHKNKMYCVEIKKM